MYVINCPIPSPWTYQAPISSSRVDRAQLSRTFAHTFAYLFASISNLFRDVQHKVMVNLKHRCRMSREIRDINDTALPL